MAVKFAFYKAQGTLLDRLIRWWMRGSYSHMEVVLADNGDGTFLCASSAPGVGVRIVSMELPERDWDIVEGPGDAAQAHAWFAERINAPYDYIGLLGFILRPVTGDTRGKYWCSQACLEAIGYPGAWREDPNSAYDVVTFSARRLEKSTAVS